MTIIDELEASYGKLSAPTVQGVQRLAAAWNAGTIDTSEFQDLLVSTLMEANAYARGVADVLAAYVLRTTGAVATAAPVGVAAVTVAAEQTRLTKAAVSIFAGLDAAEDIAGQLDRIATAEPTYAMQQQMVTTYSAHGVTGYTRGLNGGACELCVWLAKDGHVYPIDKPFNQHPGCGCSPIPTNEEN